MIPINIALTGHRDLAEDEMPIYKNTIKDILADIKAKYPNSQIQVLSGMAEGADMIGAEAALEMGCSLAAVLPMAVDDFLSTFINRELNESRFNTILSKANNIIDLSKVYKNYKEEADAYVHLGVYLTEHSQMIIALWNGVYTGSPGGTSSVIRFALEGMPRKYRTRYSIVDRHDTAPVHHIPVSRIRSEEGESPEYIRMEKEGYATLYPSVWQGSTGDKIVDYYDNLLREIDVFNKNAAKIKNNSSFLTGCNDKAALSIKGMDEILNVQSAADTLAMRWQKKTQRFLIAQLLFGFFVFFWVALVDEIVPFAPQILLLSPLFFLLCVMVSRFVSRRMIEVRYYDYRALAECLRVQCHWKGAHLKQNAYSLYSKKNEFELSWVISAAKNVSVDINYELNTNKNLSPDYDKLRQYWMQDQLNYFIKKEKSNRKLISRSKKIMYSLFGAGLLFVILLIGERLFFTNLYDGEWMMHVLLFLIDAALAGGAIFSGFLEKRQLESELKQYSRMIMIYNEGIWEFDAVHKSCEEEEIQKTIAELGADALAENADWVIYNRMNTIDIPMG